MAAPLGFKTFTTGEVLTAADTNGYLMQGIWTFANATARDAAVTSPQEGNTCYLKDTDVIQVFSGSAWVTKSGGSPLTTKGDLYGYSTADARVAVGTNGQVLTADSTAATGVTWATPSSGGMTLISTTAMSGASLTLTSIPTTYKQLQLIIVGASISGNAFVNAIFNNDSGANYTYNYIRTANTTLSGSAATGATAALFMQGGTVARTNCVLTLPRYTDTSGSQFFYVQSQGYNDSTGEIGIASTGSYAKSAAITQIKLSPQSQTWSSGTAYLYGVS